MPYLRWVLGRKPPPGFWLRICRVFLACGSDFDAMREVARPGIRGGGPDEARVVVGMQAQSVLLKHIKMR